MPQCKKAVTVVLHPWYTSLLIVYKYFVLCARWAVSLSAHSGSHTIGYSAQGVATRRDETSCKFM